MDRDVCDGAVYGLTLIIVTKLKKMKMSPYGTWALMELNYAIYDGLEMILKVTKNC